MWYKISDIEKETGMTKSELWDLFSNNKEVRKKVKSIEGVLQVDEAGLKTIKEIKLNGGKQEGAKEKDDDQDIADVISNMDTQVINIKKIREEAGLSSKSAFEPFDDISEEFDDASELNEYTYKGSIPKANTIESNILKEESGNVFDDEFFAEEASGLFEEADEFGVTSKINLGDENDLEENFDETLIFKPSTMEESMPDILSEGDTAKLNPDEFEEEEDFSGTANFEDFFSDSDGSNAEKVFGVAPDKEQVEEREEPQDIEDEFATMQLGEEMFEDTFNVDGDVSWNDYIKVLKAKMVIQNQQIRLMDEFMKTSRNMLVQDEKIVAVLEKLTKNK